jgi:transcriptional regulator with XRE-family HTH domain
MEQEELARRADVSVTTIRRLEAASGEQLVAAATTEKVRKALEEAGVEFIHQGVSLKADAASAEALCGRLRAIAERAADRLKTHDWLSDDDLYGDDGLPK